MTGTDEYTLVYAGNLGTGTHERTIDGGGSYTRGSTGAGATMPSGSGTTDYLLAQTGDPHSGTFDLIQNGTSRYDLLEDFYDISNTQTSQTPGHLNVYPFGQTFVDPGPGDPRQWRFPWERDANVPVPRTKSEVVWGGALMWAA